MSLLTLKIHKALKKEALTIIAKANRVDPQTVTSVNKILLTALYANFNYLMQNQTVSF
jgi:hypothetical protein